MMDNASEAKNDKLRDARWTQKEGIRYLLYKLEDLIDFLRRWKKASSFSSMIGYEWLNPSREELVVSIAHMTIDIVKTHNMSHNDEGANSVIVGYFVT
jgi:hypothetical protein